MHSLLSLIKKHVLNLGIVLVIVAIGISFLQILNLKNRGIIASVSLAADELFTKLPPGAPSLGNTKAKVTMIEFCDFQCPFCATFFKSIYPQIKSEFIDTGKLKVVNVDLAFLGEESRSAAQAAMCAAGQGKYWEYHDLLFKNRKGKNLGAFSRDNLNHFASNLGLDLKDFENCNSSGNYNKLIEQVGDINSSIKVTPSFVIGEDLLSGIAPIDMFRTIINRQLK